MYLCPSSHNDNIFSIYHNRDMGSDCILRGRGPVLLILSLSFSSGYPFLPSLTFSVREERTLRLSVSIAALPLPTVGGLYYLLGLRIIPFKHRGFLETDNVLCSFLGMDTGTGLATEGHYAWWGLISFLDSPTPFQAPPWPFKPATWRPTAQYQGWRLQGPWLLGVLESLLFWRGTGSGTPLALSGAEP